MPDRRAQERRLRAQSRRCLSRATLSPSGLHSTCKLRRQRIEQQFDRRTQRTRGRGVRATHIDAARCDRVDRSQQLTLAQTGITLRAQAFSSFDMSQTVKRNYQQLTHECRHEAVVCRVFAYVSQYRPPTPNTIPLRIIVQHRINDRFRNKDGTNYLSRVRDHRCQDTTN